MNWTIGSFIPSDGSKQSGVTVDHQAWLQGERDGRATIHISINMSSRGVPEAEARKILETMCAALSAGKSHD